MSRKREHVTVPSWGARDAGKIFVIEEMSAARAEKWGYRFILALKGTTAQIPENIAPLGMIAVAIRGINSILASDLDFNKVEPLLDEMISCVSMIRDRAHPDVATAIVSADDIEEVPTLVWLRSEVLRVHTNFSLAEALLEWWAQNFTKSASPPT